VQPEEETAAKEEREERENLSPGGYTRLTTRAREKLYSLTPKRAPGSREASLTPGRGGGCSRQSPSRNRSPSLAQRSPSQQEARINISLQKSLRLRQRLQEGGGASTPRQPLANNNGRSVTAPRATSARREKGALLRGLKMRLEA